MSREVLPGPGKSETAADSLWAGTGACGGPGRPLLIFSSSSPPPPSPSPSPAGSGPVEAERSGTGPRAEAAQGVLLFAATPLGPGSNEWGQRPPLGRPPVKRKLELESDHQYLAVEMVSPKGKGKSSGRGMVHCNKTCDCALLCNTLNALQISLQSSRGPVDVFLCPESGSGTCSPVKSLSSPVKISPVKVSPIRMGSLGPVTHQELLGSTSQGTILSSSSSHDQGTHLASNTSSPLGGVVDINLSPLTSAVNLLQQPDDTLPTIPFDDMFVNLSPPVFQDYHFGLDEGEGISELFDCDFDTLPPLEF
ncbi:transcription factor E2F1 [Rhincodon typus]|uniref:transcription factor E2F1 n=1 Tax=Rhincodon typus TaxID=259920 RepID=UPI00203065CA|nr:transcription factor E2F1 [Rhincodon typus]